MNQISPNFSYAEMTFSEAALRQGLSNDPPDSAVACLVRLCDDLLEPARDLLGVHLHVNSGYRSVEVNRVVGSTAIHSAHLDGRAADVVPIGMNLNVAFNKLRNRLKGWDQLIIECNSWLHISVPMLGVLPRLQAMVASGGPGNWTYSVVV